MQGPAIDFGKPRRRLLPMASTACCVMVVGCGGSATSGSNSEQITRLVHDFAAAAKKHDWNGVCDRLSTQARAQLAVAAAFIGGSDCASVMKKANEASGSDSLDKVDPAQVKVTALRITGSHATANVTPSSDGDPTTHFVREGGRWKIDADPYTEDTSSSTAESNAAPSVPTPKLQIPERGFTPTDDGASYGIALRNPTAQDATDVTVQVNFIGQGGDVLSTENADIVGIPAGRTVYVGGDTDTSGDRPVRMQVRANADAGADAGTVALPKTAGAKLLHDEYGGFTVRVQVQNTLDKPLSAISDVFAVLLDQGGHIVGGVSGYPENDIAPGSRAAVKLDGFSDVAGAVAARAFADGET